MPVDIEKLTVKRPYFAFRKLYQKPCDEWLLYGDFIPEQPMGSEAGALSISEAGRHAAILGTCLGEMQRPLAGPCYYLATSAGMRDHCYRLSEHRAQILTVRGRVLSVDNKTLSVRAQILSAGDPVMTFDVNYFRLNQLMFNTLCRSAYHSAFECFNFPASPWGRGIPLSFGEFTNNMLKARTNSHSPALCAGHFIHYPVWPVAVIMSAATQVITRLLHQQYSPELRYYVAKAQIAAKKLLSVNETIFFEASIISRDGQRLRVSCHMVDDKQQMVADLQATLYLI